MHFKSLGKILLVLLMLACSITSFAVDSLSPTNEMSIQLDQTEMVLAKGKTAKIKAILVGMELPKNTKFKWSSSDKKVASVLQGTITAVNAGEVTITCSIQLDDSELTAICRVNVVVLVTSVKSPESKLTIRVGESITPKLKVLPENATNKELLWSSSDTTIATVDKQGRITAIGGGTCKVSFETKDGSKKSGTVTVLVPTIKVTNGQHTINKLGAYEIPFNYHGKGTGSLTYTVKDPKIISVSIGYNKLIITPLSVGTTTIVLNDKNSPASKQTINLSVTDSAIANSQKIVISSAKVGKRYGYTSSDIKVRNNTGTYIDEVGVRLRFIDKYGKQIFLDTNTPKGYDSEYPALYYTLNASLKNGSIATLSDTYAGYPNASTLLVAICYFKTNDGTEHYIPESQLYWFSSDSGYMGFPSSKSNYRTPTSSEMAKSNSFKFGIIAAKFYKEYTARAFYQNAGILVREVDSGLLAEQSGIKVDDLIVSMNGVKFVDDPFMVEKAKIAMANGQEVSCVVERNNELFTLTIKK